MDYHFHNCIKDNFLGMYSEITTDQDITSTHTILGQEAWNSTGVVSGGGSGKWSSSLAGELLAGDSIKHVTGHLLQRKLNTFAISNFKE